MYIIYIKIIFGRRKTKSSCQNGERPELFTISSEQWLHAHAEETIELLDDLSMQFHDITPISNTDFFLSLWAASLKKQFIVVWLVTAKSAPSFRCRYAVRDRRRGVSGSASRRSDARKGQLGFRRIVGVNFPAFRISVDAGNAGSTGGRVSRLDSAAFGRAALSQTLSKLETHPRVNHDAHEHELRERKKEELLSSQNVNGNWKWTIVLELFFCHIVL